jgi:hypothetical protein
MSANPDVTAKQTARMPTRLRAVVFAFKAFVLRWRRRLRDSTDYSLHCHHPDDALVDAPILAESVTPLLRTLEDDFDLTLGKIHNLRIARKAFHGIVVPARSTLSFWRQLGRPSRLRGFTAGRELREGCVIPSTGGGLCQLSNALYDAALGAGFEIVERHRHSIALTGSAAATDRDATVFWNYVDLRLRSDAPFRIEVELDAQSLRVRIRGERAGADMKAANSPGAARTTQSAHQCSHCGVSECFRNYPPLKSRTHTAWLLDDLWPEFLQHVRATAEPGDWIGSSRKIPGDFGAGIALHAAGFHRWRAALQLRWQRLRRIPLAKTRIQNARALARSLARRLRSRDTHLVVAQSLLPYLHESGELAGRSYDVLMTSFPMAALQAQLDLARSRNPQSTTLGDFRAPQWLVDAEAKALAGALSWVSPHQGVLELAPGRAASLSWRTPAVATSMPRTATAPPRIFFPASALARKGAYELREAIQGLAVSLTVLKGPDDAADFWAGIDVQSVLSIGAGLDQADLVVLPAWIEHQPRALLQALLVGKPVVATPACGLARHGNWSEVAAGDVAGLRNAIRRYLDSHSIQRAGT